MAGPRKTQKPGSTAKPARPPGHDSQEKAPNLDRRDESPSRERAKSHSHIDESGAPIDDEGDRAP